MGGLARSVYRNLAKHCMQFDARPELRNLLLDSALEYTYADGGGGVWRRTGARNIAAVAHSPHHEGTLMANLRREYSKVDKENVGVAFKQLAYFNAALDVYEKLKPFEQPLRDVPATPLLQRMPVLLPCTLPDAFLLITHPLAMWNDTLNNQSVALVMKDVHGRCKAFTLNFPYGTVSDIFSLVEKNYPHFSSLLGCPVRLGGYMQQEGVAQMTCFHRCPDIADSVQLFPGLYSTSDLDAISAAVQADEAPASEHDFIFFLGHQEWEAGYVEGLIENGHATIARVPANVFDWIVPPVSPAAPADGGGAGDKAGAAPTTPDASDEKYRFWQKFCLHLGPPCSEWALFPKHVPALSEAVNHYLDSVSCQ